MVGCAKYAQQLSKGFKQKKQPVEVAFICKKFRYYSRSIALAK